MLSFLCNTQVSLLNKVPRVPKCLSAQLSFECLSAQVPMFPSSTQVLPVFMCPSAVSAQVILEFPSSA